MKNKLLRIRIAALLLALAALLSFSACSDNAAADVSTVAETEPAAPAPEIVLQEFDTWNIHTTTQQKFLDDSDMDATKYVQGESELSYPRSRTFNWELCNVEDENKPKTYTYRYGEKEDLSDALEYSCKFNDFCIENGGMNLKVRTTYYWQVSCTLQDGTEVVSKVSSFTTSGGIRNMYIEGVANFRDLGGKDCDGGVLRQNMIFRCGRLHQNYSYTQKIGQKGIDKLLALGIKSEIDLRGKLKDGIYENGNYENGSFTVTQSVLGSSVTYYHCGAVYSDYMLTYTEGKKMVRDTFAILADESNYPLLFHCSIGTDRTGFIAILVEGVCGVSEKEILQDYLFSNFGDIGGTRSSAKFDNMVAAIKACSGSNFMEKCRTYLKSIGVTYAQIDSVRNILIEKN